MMKDPGVQKLVAEVRTQTFEQVTARIARLGLKAVKTLDDLLKASGEATRLGAVRAILDGAIRLKHVAEFEERLRKLEEDAADEPV